MELGEAAERKITAPKDRAWFQGQPRKALEDGRENDLALEAGERSAETEVSGPTEGKVAIVLACEIEAVGLGETLGIAIAGSQDGHDCLAAPNELAAKRDVRRSHAGGVLGGRLETQQLLDGGGNERIIIAEALEFSRMTEQGEDAIADEIGGGFQTTDKCDDAVGDDLVFGKAVTRDFSGQHGADQSRARMSALLADNFTEVADKVFDGVQHFRSAVRIVLEIADDFREVRGPLFELAVLGAGQAEQFGGDDGGERLGKVLHDFHATARLDGIKQFLGELHDAVAEFRDSLRSEGASGEIADSRVGGRVKEEHLLDHDLGEGVEAGEALGIKLFGRGSARGGEVAQDRDDVGIAGDDPRVEKGVPVNGIFGSQARKKGIRIGQNLRIEQAEQAKFGVTRNCGTVRLQIGAQGVQHGVAP